MPTKCSWLFLSQEYTCMVFHISPFALCKLFKLTTFFIRNLPALFVLWRIISWRRFSICHNFINWMFILLNGQYLETGPKVYTFYCETESCRSVHISAVGYWRVSGAQTKDHFSSGGDRSRREDKNAANDDYLRQRSGPTVCLHRNGKHVDRIIREQTEWIHLKDRYSYCFLL